MGGASVKFGSGIWDLEFGAPVTFYTLIPPTCAVAVDEVYGLRNVVRVRVGGAEEGAYVGEVNLFRILYSYNVCGEEGEGFPSFLFFLFFLFFLSVESRPGPSRLSGLPALGR